MFQKLIFYSIFLIVSLYILHLKGYIEFTPKAKADLQNEVATLKHKSGRFAKQAVKSLIEDGGDFVNDVNSEMDTEKTLY